MLERKHLDMRRWACMARPQYPSICGATSLTSVWNYLYSTLGAGSLPPITTEEALTIIGFSPPFDKFNFGPITGNATLIKWFEKLNQYHGVKGNARISFKLHGKDATLGKDSETALLELQQGLRSENRGYIYHCENHYMCPIGFESSPANPEDAYKENWEIQEFVHWIISGDPSPKYPVFNVAKWSDIFDDINTVLPMVVNIRKIHQGVYEKPNWKENRIGNNLHWLIEFERCDEQEIEIENSQQVVDISIDNQESSDNECNLDFITGNFKMSSNQVQEPTQLSNDNSSWLSEDIDSSSNPIEESTEIEEQKSQPSAQQKKEVKKANGKRKQAAPGQAKQAQKSRDNPQTTEESKNPQCDLSKRSFTQLRGPFILTAPHGLQIFRGQHCHQEVKLHQRERYTTQMVIRLSMELEKLMGGGSFACWNEKVATQQDKSNEDPNYMTKRQLEGSAWNQCLKNFKKKMATDAKLPTFHIDMHGKMRRKHGRIIMDLGPRQMERLWRPRDFTEKCRTAFVDEITQVFNWVNTTREVPFEIEAHPTTLTGMWINGVNHTMSHQSLLLGMPAFQMEFPPEMRAEFIQNQEFLERFAQAIVNAYKKIYDFDENGWNSLCDRVKKLSPPSESLMQSYDEFLEFVATVDKRITRF